jgi:two-component system, OmpR family, sensor kinase
VSLRARVLLGLTVIAAVLVIAASVIIRTTESYLLEQIDAQLHAITMPMRDGGFGGGPAPQQPRPDDQQRPSPLYTGYIADDGTVQTVDIPNFGQDEVPLPEISADDALASVRRGEPFTVGSVDSTDRYRVQASIDDRTGAVVVVALPLGDTDAAVQRLVLVEIAATVAALGALALVAWWVIRLGVRPVNDMAEAAEAIAAGDLSHRVPESDPQTEAGKLGLALNQMLGRIEETFEERTRTDERLRRFVADASHELRTPVTTIRGYAELYRAGGLAPGEQMDEAMRRTEQEAMRMGALVEDMLQLARLDQGRPVEAVPVDLGSLARDAAADARAVRPNRSVTAHVNEEQAPTTGEPVPVLVLGDSDRLRQIIANLVANALVHTDDDAAIEIGVERRGADVVLEVTDHGAGMPPEVAQRAFERFFRADPSRSRHQGGSGLGLAIVQAVVAAHGGHIELRSVVGTGTTVRVLLPLAGPAPTPPPTPALVSAV